MALILSFRILEELLCEKYKAYSPNLLNNFSLLRNFVHHAIWNPNNMKTNESDHLITLVIWPLHIGNLKLEQAADSDRNVLPIVTLSKSANKKSLFQFPHSQHEKVSLQNDCREQSKIIPQSRSNKKGWAGSKSK